MSTAIREAALVQRIKEALRADESQKSQTNPGGIAHNRGPPIEDPPVYTVVEFCARHKISRSALYTMWDAGTGPRFFKIGTAVRISREAAIQWLIDRETASKGKPVADSAE